VGHATIIHDVITNLQALFKRVRPDGMGQETNDSCRNLFLNCEDSRTANIVDEYAENNTQWHEDFGIAFQILIEYGYPNGHLVEAGEELPILIDPIVSSPTPTASDTDGTDTTSAFNTDATASAFSTDTTASASSTDTPASAFSVKATAIVLLLASFGGMVLTL